MVLNVGFYLSFLRLRFASSLYAIRETLTRLVAGEGLVQVVAEATAEVPAEAEEEGGEHAGRDERLRHGVVTQNLGNSRRRIETEAQHRLVAEAGCELGQGFLMAQPMPPSQLLQA